ncbi:hypothetical protein SCUP515_09208 [Seiridium cupressi]
MSPNGNTRWGNPEMHTQLLLAVVEACLKDGKLLRTQANAAASVMAAKGFNVTGEAIRSKPISKSRFWSSTNVVSYRKRTEAINGFQVANVLSQRVASVRRVIHVPTRACTSARWSSGATYGRQQTAVAELRKQCTINEHFSFLRRLPLVDGSSLIETTLTCYGPSLLQDDFQAIYYL